MISKGYCNIYLKNRFVIKLKHLVFVFGINSILWPFDSRSQINVYFQNSPEWGQTSKCSDNPPCVDQRQLNYYLNGDTVINSFVYKKVFQKYQGSFAWFSPNPTTSCPPAPYYYIPSAPSYFLRSAGKQMYLRKPGNVNEYLLYDFNLAVGSSLPLTYNNASPSVTVTLIDTVNTINGLYQRFHLSGNTLAQYLIEGIGSSTGLFESMQQDVNCTYNLVCYSQNNNGYYPIIGGTCDLSVSIAENEMNSKAGISPNPFNNAANVHFNTEIDEAHLVIYNLYGELVSVQGNFSGSNCTLKRENLSAGVYFLYLRQENFKTFIAKIIVAD